MISVRLEGNPAAMGEAFGEAFRREIGELHALRRANALEQARRFGGREITAETLLAVAARMLEVTACFDEEGHAELVGIARGADLKAEEVMAMNALTDIRDVLAWGGEPELLGGCTGVLVQADRCTDRAPRLAQTWDLATTNLPFVVAVHRRPLSGPETWSVTTVGCLSLMALSAHGLAIGTTNLRTRDARVGVPYLSLIHRALRCPDATRARACIEAAPRSAGHSYLLADAEGQMMVLECTATRSCARLLRRGADVQTNHCQGPELAALEAETPMASSRARLDRMRKLLAGSEPLDDFELIRFLGDRDGGALSINRDDVDGISTNAACVLAPGRGTLLACQGAPDRAIWQRFGPGRVGPFEP